MKSNADTLSQTIYSGLFPPKPLKSDRRKMDILAGAVKAYAAVDFSHVSFDDVARPAKTSARLVQHYFPNKDELFSSTMKMIRAEYQALVVEAMNHVASPEDQFRQYIYSALDWGDLKPNHLRAWFLYFCVCAQKTRFRKEHEILANMGEERIQALVRALPQGRNFKEPELHFIAKTIQRLITGALIEFCSEQGGLKIEDLKKEVFNACVRIVGP